MVLIERLEAYRLCLRPKEMYCAAWRASGLRCGAFPPASAPAP